MKTDNELIAEFMGGVSREKIFPEDRQIIKTSEHGNCYTENLKYDTSWDWLMPVVFKIDKLYNENFPPDFIQRVISKESEIIDSHYMNVIAVPMATPIEEIYKEVVEFVKWHNSNNK